MTFSQLKLTSSESSWDRARKETSIFDARTGYDRIAPAYDSSPWRRFWRKNEYPIVKKIFLRLLHKYPFQGALDIGSGTGFYSRFLENYVPKVVGVDISSEMLRIASEKSKGAYVNVDFLSYRSEYKFDFALSARTLSHIKDTGNFFRHVDNNTNDGACIIITDIHPKHNYYKTQFEVNGETIEIETHKHEMRDIFDKILGSFSDHIMYKEFDFSNLQDKWLSTEFRSVFNSVDPVFYMMVFRKRARLDQGINKYMRDVLKFSSVFDIK